MTWAMIRTKSRELRFIDGLRDDSFDFDRASWRDAPHLAARFILFAAGVLAVYLVVSFFGMTIGDPAWVGFGILATAITTAVARSTLFPMPRLMLGILLCSLPSGLIALPRLVIVISVLDDPAAGWMAMYQLGLIIAQFIGAATAVSARRARNQRFIPHLLAATVPQAILTFVVAYPVLHLGIAVLPAA